MVTISGSNPLQTTGSALLDEFERVASNNGSKLIELDGEKLRVLGHGTLPGSGRSVAWVDASQDGSAASSVTRVFAEALSDRFGSRLASGIARELGLDITAGKPIESRTVTAAIDMARTASNALEGSYFALRLSFDPVLNGTGFSSVVNELGLDPGRFDAGVRDEVKSRLESFLSRSDTPLTDLQVRAELAAIIHDVLGSTPERQ